jgi:leucyl-tRNA synthetase
MFLESRGFIGFKEPFTSLIHQGMILGTDGAKMSKSKGNTKEPDEYTSKYGSDILRLFMLFGFNYTEGGPWNDSAVKTVTRFTERIETLVEAVRRYKAEANKTKMPEKLTEADKELLYVRHNTIKAVRRDLDAFSFNTAVARCMELLNAIVDYMNKAGVKDGTNQSGNSFHLLHRAIETLVLLVSPMVPHIAEEYWERLGGTKSVFDQDFPTADEKYLIRDTVEIAVQINSKIVARIEVPSTAAADEVEAAARRHEKTAAVLAGRVVKKVIYIAGKLVNLIV